MPLLAGRASSASALVPTSPGFLSSSPSCPDNTERSSRARRLVICRDIFPNSATLLLTRPHRQAFELRIHRVSVSRRDLCLALQARCNSPPEKSIVLSLQPTSPSSQALTSW